MVDGVTQAPGVSALPPNGQQLLFTLRNANMATAGVDQPFTKQFIGTFWDPQTIVFNCKSGAFNTACVGGIFTLPAKGGSAVIAVGTSYATLTGVNTQVNPPVQTTLVTFAVPIIYLNLTTGNATALIADVFIYGFVLD